jgi:hypothetical protein
MSRHLEGQVLTLNQVINTKFWFESCAERELFCTPPMRKKKKENITTVVMTSSGIKQLKEWSIVGFLVKATN